jgi:hypothetical protein
MSQTVPRKFKQIDTPLGSTLLALWVCQGTPGVTDERSH